MSGKADSNRPRGTFCGRTRREFLWEAGGAFTSVALTGLLSADGFLGRQAQAADGVSARSPIRWPPGRRTSRPRPRA